MNTGLDLPSSGVHAEEIPGGGEYQNGAVGTLPMPCGEVGGQEAFCSR